jgi:hypothetical protein
MGVGGSKAVRGHWQLVICDWRLKTEEVATLPIASRGNCHAAFLVVDRKWLAVVIRG